MTVPGSGNCIGLGNFKGVKARDDNKYQDNGKKENFRSIRMKNSCLYMSYGLNAVTLKFTCGSPKP